MNQITVKKIKVIGTQANTEQFITGSGKLLYNYGATVFPPIDLTTTSVSMICDGSIYQDAKINQVGNISQSGNNISFFLAVSDTGKASIDGFCYCDITFFLETIIPEVIIDSYNETNRDATEACWYQPYLISQSFTGKNALMTKCIFNIYNGGYASHPPGFCRAKLFAHSGTFGVTSTPTGSPLATSDNVDCALIDNIWRNIEFNFPLPYILSEIYYCIVIEYYDGDGSSGKRLYLGQDVTSVPESVGNTAIFIRDAGTWVIGGTHALCFYVKGISL